MGLSYQDKVSESIFKHMKIPLTTYCSSLNQETKGENMQGWEIKYVGQAKTRFFLEIASRPTSNHPWKDSGVFKKDNSYMYVIGDEDNVYFFWKKTLIDLIERERKKADGEKPILEYFQSPTGKGYYITREMAESLWGLKMNLTTGELSQREEKMNV